MINITEKSNCIGCSACAASCPRKCIIMSEDSEGFLYPQIDGERCIRCGICETVCPMLHPPALQSAVSDAYAAYNRENEVRAECSSGGIFPLLSELTLRKHGVVYGAAFDESFAVEHRGAETAKELKALYSSKYVQSHIGHCYNDVKKQLEAGRFVLFSGTPCQVARLKSFLNFREYDNLLTVDFICHGVPSPKVWEKYLHESLEAQNRAERISFRDKRHGWSDFGFLVRWKNGKVLRETSEKNAYMKGFLQNLFLRPSCHDCRFKTVDRCSDLTIADCWGIRHILPALYDDKGCSLILPHTKKGEEAFDAVKNACAYHAISRSEAVRHNSAALKSAPPHRNRAAFFERYTQENLSGLTRELCKEPFSQKISKAPKRILKFIKRKLYDIKSI